MANDGTAGGSGNAGTTESQTTQNGGQSPGQAPGTGTPAGGSNSSTEPFYASFKSDELKGYMRNKGFESPEVLADSYRNLEKLRGVPQERLLTLPENLDDDAAMGQVFGRLGRPEKADGYEFDVPEGSRADYAGFLKETFHKAGLTTKQAKTVAAAWNQRVQDIQKEAAQAANDAFSQQEQKLRQEWGEAYDKNLKIAASVADALQVPQEDREAIEAALGVDKAAKLFHNIVGAFGIELGESPFVGTGSGNNFGAMSPAAAQERINFLKQDPEFTKKYLSGDVTARAEMDRLHRMAAAGRQVV